MDDLLTPVSTTYTKKARPGIHEVDEVATPASSTAKSAVKVDTPSIALDILKSQPDYDQLVKVLAYLAERSRRDEPPDAEPGWHGIGSPSPQSASLIQALVTDIVPNYWTLLQEGRTREKSMQRDVDLLVSCLQSVAGVNALLLRIRSLIADVRCAGPRDPSIALNLSALLGTLSAVLDGEKEIFHIWEATSRGVDDARKRRLFCQELVATFTSGKISSYAAEAEDVVKDALKNSTSYWISDSREYSRWLGSSIVFCAVSTHTAVNEELRKLGPALYEKCARLPHYGMKDRFRTDVRR